jgi:hypothetical protein
MKKICWSSGVKVGLEKSKTPDAGLDVGRLELRKTPTSASTGALVSLQSLAFAVAKTATALQRTSTVTFRHQVSFPTFGTLQTIQRP